MKFSKTKILNIQITVFSSLYTLNRERLMKEKYELILTNLPTMLMAMYLRYLPFSPVKNSLQKITE